MVKAWFAQQSDIAIPFTAFLEVQQGIFDVALQKPEKAEELIAWLRSILDSDYTFPPMTPDVAFKTAELYSYRPLKNLWYKGEQSNKKPGQDLAFAAISIVYDIPIATFDGYDFKLIDTVHPLPGVYDPSSDTWLVKPTSSKRMKPPSSIFNATSSRAV